MSAAIVLLAGMNRYPNQISRNLEKLGCEVVHLSGDPGGHIPDHCDAAVITKTQISHEKFYKVKDAYHSLNKPVFITDFGFSPIRERFMAFIAARPKPIEPITFNSKFKDADTALAKALREAQEQQAPEIIEAPAPPPESGEEPIPSVKVHEKKAPKKRLARAKWNQSRPEIKEVASSMPNLMDMIAIVLSQDYDLEERVQEVKRLLQGEAKIISRIVADGLQLLALSGMNREEPRLILNLSKVQAAAILSSIKDIEEFLG